MIGSSTLQAVHLCLNPNTFFSSGVMLTVSSFLLSASLTVFCKMHFFLIFLCFVLLVIFSIQSFAICLHFFLFMLNCLWLRQVAFLLHVSPCLAPFCYCAIHTVSLKGYQFSEVRFPLRYIFHWIPELIELWESIIN